MDDERRVPAATGGANHTQAPGDMLVNFQVYDGPGGQRSIGGSVLMLLTLRSGERTRFTSMTSALVIVIIGNDD